MLLASKILFTLIVVGVAYFALLKIWTKDVDILGLLKGLSKGIPVIEEKTRGVVVTPSEINLTTTDWSKTHIIEVKNKNPVDTLYSVWIKISSGSEIFDPQEIVILSEKGQSFVTETFSGVTANFELLKVYALDSKGYPCVYLVIYRIEALESKFFKVKRDKPKGNEFKPLTAFFEMKGFSTKAATIATQVNKTALEIQPPENLQIKAIITLLKRNEP